MAKSEMVNFRVKSEDMKRIDEAAEQQGMDRSTFCRHCVSHQVELLLGGGPVETVGVRGPAAERAQYIDKGCPKMDFCRFVLDDRRQPICQTCGAQR